jgi:hypothetical protein
MEVEMGSLVKGNWDNGSQISAKMEFDFFLNFRFSVSKSLKEISLNQAILLLE